MVAEVPVTDATSRAWAYTSYYTTLDASAGASQSNETLWSVT